MKQHGFTLIEMIVVVAIFGILIAAGVASYNSMNDRAQVEEAARTIMSELRSLQKDVNSGRSTCTGTDAFEYIDITDSGNPLQPISYADNCGGTDLLPEKPLKNGLIITVPSITIHTLNKGINPTGNIIVQNTSGTIIYTIEITASGGMSVKKD